MRSPRVWSALIQWRVHGGRRQAWLYHAVEWLSLHCSYVVCGMNISCRLLFLGVSNNRTTHKNSVLLFLYFLREYHHTRNSKQTQAAIKRNKLSLHDGNSRHGHKRATAMQWGAAADTNSSTTGGFVKHTPHSNKPQKG